MGKLFGTDGIRGKAGLILNAPDVLKIAMAAGVFFKAQATTNKIVLGKDTRRSGYMIENSIVAGLTAIGFDVIQIGPMPTPAVAFLSANMRCDAGIMISASHNLYEDNGIKFFNSKGQKLSDDDEAKIEALFFDEDTLLKHYATGKNIGTSKRIDDVIGRYIVHIKNSFPSQKTLLGMRIVVDVGHGAAYKVAPQIFSELGAEVFTINNAPDGFNINQNCGALHCEVLAHEVIQKRANVGFALDGDADRLVVVDEQGNVIDGDNLMASIAKYLKDNNQLKGNALVTTIMSNGALEVFCKEQNIDFYKVGVGDRQVTQKMRELGCNFGGEESGHIVFSDFSHTGDGLLSALQVLSILTHDNSKASIALKQFSPFNRLLQNLKVKNKPPIETLQGYDACLSHLQSNGLDVLIRYSGTENVLRILLEGEHSMGDLELYMRDVVDFFKTHLGIQKDK